MLVDCCLECHCEHHSFTTKIPKSRPFSTDSGWKKWCTLHNVIYHIDESCEGEIGGFSPKSSHLFIGFSIISTIHFGGKPPIFWKHPYNNKYHILSLYNSVLTRIHPPGIQKCVSSVCKKRIQQKHQALEGLLQGFRRVRSSEAKLWNTPACDRHDNDLKLILQSMDMHPPHKGRYTNRWM